MKNLLIAATLLAASGPAFAQDVVRLGTEGAYPPYNFINDAGEVAGFEREFGDELCKRASLTCEWVTNEWDSIIPNLQSGNYDVIIAGMSITDEREEVIDFSAGYLPPASSAYLTLSADADLMSGPRTGCSWLSTQPRKKPLLL
jgi:polar amino acid transport system substrate-binding protein